MKFPRLTTRRIIAALVVLAFVQAGSSAFRRYLRCQATAESLVVSEGVYRQKAGVCEEMSPRLREVATLAREMAKSASSDFERSKWLEMARTEEEKAAKFEHESVQLLIKADRLASRANALYTAAWRPWLAVEDQAFP